MIWPHLVRPVLSLCAISLAARATLRVDLSEGGFYNVPDDGEAGWVLHAGKTIAHPWYVVNDSGAPVQLDASGVSATSFESVNLDKCYALFSKIKATASADRMSNIEVGIVLLDIFGKSIKDITLIDHDVHSSGDIDLAIGVWPLARGLIEDFAASVVYVVSARYDDGHLWTAKQTAISRLVSRIAAQVTSLERSVNSTETGALMAEENKRHAVEAGRIAQLRAQRQQRIAESAREQEAAKERDQVIRARCAAIYRETAQKKIADVTVAESTQIGACESIGAYSPR